MAFKQEDRIFHLAKEMLASEVAAKWWLSTPKLALGGVAPETHARTEEGAREVEHLIGRLMRRERH